MVAIALPSSWGGRAAFSEATLALLDDTGWYVTNRENAGKLIWGKGAGCSFLTGACCCFVVDHTAVGTFSFVLFLSPYLGR